MAPPSQSYGGLWPFVRLDLLDTRIISLDPDATGELYVLTNDALGPFGSTGKIFKLLP